MENPGQTRRLKEEGNAGLPQQQEACSRLQRSVLHGEEQDHRITESSRLEKTRKIIQSNH